MEEPVPELTFLDLELINQDEPISILPEVRNLCCARRARTAQATWDDTLNT
jgi:hypothetical protein